jgi:hypothetical protein
LFADAQDEIFVNQYRVPKLLLDEKPFLVPSVCDRIVNCAMNFSMKGKPTQSGTVQ